MTTKSLDDNTYWLLLQVAIRSKHDFARLAELYDLSVMQLITLCSLEPNKPVPMNSISYFLACDASNVTGIVDRLAARSFIERKESSEDRRVKVIQLTAKGEHQRKNVIDEVVSSAPHNMSNLDAKELEQFNNLLKKALSSKSKTA